MTMKLLRARAATIVLVPCALAAVACGAAKHGYPQDVQDQDTLWAFATLLTDLRNTHIAGTPTGAKDITVSQPGGGSVRITGQTQSSGSNLNYTFSSYQAELQGSGHRAVLSHLDGDMTSATASGTTSYSGDGLAVSGSLERDGYDPVPLAGPLALDCTYTSAAASGSVNARSTVSWTSSGSTGGGDTSDCDPSYFSRCHQVVNGIEFMGAAWPKRCGACPGGTYQAGEDNVTPNGPYWQCMCR